MDFLNTLSFFVIYTSLILNASNPGIIEKILNFILDKAVYIVLGALLVLIYEGTKRGVKAGARKLAQQGKPKLIGLTILAFLILLIILLAVIGGIW